MPITKGFGELVAEIKARLSDPQAQMVDVCYMSDFPAERIYRDVRVCQIYEGTSDVQKIIIQRMLA